MDEQRRVRLLVEGRVQGVYYRASLRRQAERRGISGWVRNLEDGRVQALLAGQAAAVALLIDWCREGPSGARVERLTAEDLPQAEQQSGFRVMRTAPGPETPAG